MAEFDIEPYVFSEAVRHFWRTRQRQGKEQKQRGTSDRGKRSFVTGGKQLDGFVEEISQRLLDVGVGEEHIYVTRSDLYVPGYFRPEKKWDMLVIRDNKLFASIELKSQVSSYGNNFNNRTEEAIGNAEDLWTAYREGLLEASPQPWLGFLLLLNDEEAVHTPVRVREPHFPVDEAFKEASYAERYENMLTRLVRERKYNSACFLMASENGAEQEKNYNEPCEALNATQFLDQLLRHVGDFGS